MAARHRSRRRAVQILYQSDMRKHPVEEAIGAFYLTLYSSEDESGEEPERPPRRDRFMEQLANGTESRREEIDRLIQQHSMHWRVDRMAAVDRAILRLAVYELLAATVPPAVAIDEALELARRFSGDESVGFINGVLDAVRKALQSSTAN